MKLQALNLSPIQNHNTSLQPQNKKAESSPIQRNQIGEFPSYYCPNINFTSRFGEVDFDYDFYNCANNIIKNHLDKMELTKDLSKAEQEDFRNNLSDGDIANVFQFFNDKKPCALLTGEFPYFQNNDKYDFVRRTIRTKPRDTVYEHKNIFILNKELTKKTIEENQELYTKRMGLKNDATVDEIYENLVGENSPLKKQTGYDDIIGVTLGFSPINSILFQLENNIPNHIELRRHPRQQSEILKRELYSGDCVYNNFSFKFLSNVENAIDNISRPHPRQPNLSEVGYMCIQFVPDEKHTQMVIRNSEEILEKNKHFLN